MITVSRLTKRYGPKLAVDDLTVAITPGKITGFLGPNGAGKSTTMRMIVGLDRPTSGSALIDGKPYAALRHPLREVGALLDADEAHPSRTARSHLAAISASNKIPRARAGQVLDLVGLSDVADRRVKTFSLGMRQRLGIATALLGDPPVLLLDEPVNGLDPDGVRWIRDLMRTWAAEGRTVLVSSHLLGEMQETADHLVLLGRGHLLADQPLAQVLDSASRRAIRVRTPDPERLTTLLSASGATAERIDATTLVVNGHTLQRIGDLAFGAGIAVHELSLRSAALEDAFLELTDEHLQHPTSPLIETGES